MINLKASKRKLRRWRPKKWRKGLVIVAAGLFGLLIVIQLFYPSDRLVPFAKVDGMSVGGELKKDAEAKLDDAYRQSQVGLYFEGAQEPYRLASMTELGLMVSNDDRLAGVDYPWYQRLIPSSLFWVHLVQATPSISYERRGGVLDEYIATNFGNPCAAPTTNATLGAEDGQIKLTRGATGGICDSEEVAAALRAYVPALTDLSVDLRGEVVLPAISNADATVYAETLMHNIKDQIVLSVDDQTLTIPANTIVGWLLFPDSNTLQYVLDDVAASDYLLANIADKVAKPAGTSTVTMRNFVEESRSDAALGRQLDVATTLESINNQIKDGTPAKLATAEVPPALHYDYTFAANNEALSVVMKNYAQTHSGSYAATLIEISKDGRYATFNGSKQFVTASTYKLFVAYSTLLRVEDGTFRWTDSINSGRNLSRCFDDMIRLSDNACAEALIRRIGMDNLTADAKAIGCAQTVFVSGNIRSTTEDQTRLLGLLYSGRVLSDQANQDKLFAAMKVNVYREGIPAGLPGITVADKVGFLDELLHDSAIVYSPTGMYVLTIYTADATWGNIAELAAQLEAARAK